MENSSTNSARAANPCLRSGSASPKTSVGSLFSSCVPSQSRPQTLGTQDRDHHSVHRPRSHKISLFRCTLVLVVASAETPVFTHSVRFVAGETVQRQITEQIDFSDESKLIFPALQQHQIALFFSRILCVRQLNNPPARLFL